MATPIWINYRESTHGVNSGGYQDVSNRPSRTIWNNFCLQHNKDGTHKDDMVDADVLQMETGTYTGDGNDDRTITLTNTGLAVHFVRIFSEAYTHTWFATSDMAGYAIKTEGYAGINRIQSMGTGEFEIGSDPEVNNSGTKFYYIVYGAQT